MDIAPRVAERYLAGDLCVDAGAMRVTRGGQPLRLQGLSFDLLLTLVRAAPDVVSVDQLMDRAWPGLVVSPETVSQRVKLLREALGDESRDPRYVAVVRGRGYRFVASVAPLAAAEPGSRPAAPPWRTWAALGALALVLALAAYLALDDAREASAPAIPVAAGLGENSIAVLPFENRSRDGADGALLADGLLDDLLTQLAKVASLEVISRSSVMAYRGSHKNVRVIGQALGVAHILEGSVQQAGGRVRVNVQLIDTRSDAHRWAETYDRELTAHNLLAIQTDIAQAVSTALLGVLPVREGDSGGVSTGNTTAYLAYLSGKFQHNAWFIDNAADGLQKAEEHFRRAVDLDPGFAAAHAALARVMMERYWQGEANRPRDLEEAHRRVIRTLELAPQLPEAHIAEGFYHYYGFRDYARALTAFEEAERLMPGGAEIHVAKGLVLQRMGRGPEALASFGRARQLDPANLKPLFYLVDLHASLRDYPAAEALIAQVQQRFPRDSRILETAATLAFMRTGDTAGYRRALAAIPGASPWSRWWAAFLDRDFAAAEAVLSEMPAAYDAQPELSPRALLLGLTLQYAGQAQRSREAYLEARAIVAEQIALQTARPQDLNSALGIALAGLGEKDAGVDAARRAVSQLPIAADGFEGGKYVLRLATVYAMVGERRQALAAIDQALRAPGWYNFKVMSLDPRFDSVREDSAYRELARAHSR
jgi:TolB-like protein/DNA-binding winged helix-turn-helix (wHTH) protein/Flp pilus assembly protein TadD